MSIRYAGMIFESENCVLDVKQDLFCLAKFSGQIRNPYEKFERTTRTRLTRQGVSPLNRGMDDEFVSRRSDVSPSCRRAWNSFPLRVDIRTARNMPVRECAAVNRAGYSRGNQRSFTSRAVSAPAGVDRSRRELFRAIFSGFCEGTL